jgi:C4-dicarboxylate transporter, DctM subunit
MDAYLLFGIFILVLLLFLTTGVPVGVALGMIGILGTLLFGNPSQLARLAQTAFGRSSDYVFLVIPLFVFMGAVLSEGKIGEDLYTCAQRWMGRLPGSLAIATIFACAAFGSVCGSSPVTARTIGAISIPEMVKRGYDQRLALGATAAGGTLGIMIPPSLSFVVYGIITETSIGKLFMAGFLPGILLACLLSAVVLIFVLRQPQLAPTVARSTWKERFAAFRGVWPAAVLSFAVLGSIYLGIATATESAAVGALGSLLLALAMRRLSKQGLRGVLLGTVNTSSMIMLILVGGLFASFVLSRFGIAQGMATALTGLPIGPWGVMILINALLLVFGMFLDPLSIAVITLPVFFPTVMRLGFDPIWFGVIITLNMEVAAISPPVGFNLFVLKGIVPGATMKNVITGSMWFVVPLLLGMVILSFFPQIALWLPSLMASR